MLKNIQDSAKTLSIIIIAAINLVPFLALGATSAPSAPTVDDCVSRTGMTKEKCTEMISNFKNSTPGSGTKKGPPQGAATGQGQPPTSGTAGVSDVKPSPVAAVSTNDASAIDDSVEKATSAKTQKADQFSQTENRIEKIIEFLKSKNIDTTAVENNLATFKSEAALVLGVFDTYIRALNDAKTNATTSETSPTSADSAKTQIKTLTADLVGFYTATLRTSLDTAIEQITQ